MKHPADFTKKPDDGPDYKYVKCDCPCHYTPGMMHFVACCENGWMILHDWPYSTEELKQPSPSELPPQK